MSAVYGTAVFGGIGEQQVGENGAIAQQLPPYVNGTFTLKGGRRSQRKSQRKSQRRRGGKSQRKNKRKQQKGGN